ncbi:MAG: class I SAM-dependent methyltransferase [Candidatus Omnitrophica bacterium]|nr:class I SAM-dependent methyltransferase [Candidatus Omnitrophota bacterium]
MDFERWKDEQPPEEFIRNNAPHIDTEEVPLCPVCGHNRFQPVAVGFDFELLTCRNPWRFVRCQQCAHVWLHPRPAFSTLRTIYPPTYYAYNYAEQINPLAVKGKALLDRLKIRSILRHHGRRVTSYLDVGCGEGRFLHLFKALGVTPGRIFGIDLDEKTVQSLARQGYQAICQRVEDCTAIPDGTLDLVTMFHVLEHVHNPAAVVRRIVSWMAPGGLLAIETPNIDSFDARLFLSGCWGGYHIPRHWHIFHPDSLAKLLGDAGLEVVAAKFLTGHSFWIYSFHHRIRYGRPPRPGLARLFNPFQNLFLLALVSGFDVARAAVGCRTSAMLMMARKP